MRWLDHLLANRWTLARRFPSGTLDAIESAVADSESRHRGEVRFAIEAGLDVPALWRGERARERALAAFAELGVWDTRERNGVLVYLLLAERDVEIVADRGLDGVSADEWEAVCREIERAFHEGHWRDGALAGIAGVSALLEREFPRSGAPDRDEQPNRPAIL